MGLRTPQVNTGDTHPDLKHPFFGDVLVGLRQALGASHYDLLLFTEREGFLRRAVQHQLDGLVLMGVDRRDPDLRGVLDRRVPAMNVDLDVSGRRAGYVMSDNVGGARAATRHLVELGHVRIATITGLSNTKPAIDRLRGYREELLAHGLLYRTTYVRAGDFYSLSGHEQTRRLLALRRPPTAIFAASDEMALGAVSAIHEAGLSVPHDVSVVGFDDIESASLLRPPLTTIRQNKTALGRIASESLIRLIEDDDAKPPRIALAVELAERSSAGPPSW